MYCAAYKYSDAYGSLLLASTAYCAKTIQPQTFILSRIHELTKDFITLRKQTNLRLVLRK